MAADNPATPLPMTSTSVNRCEIRARLKLSKWLLFIGLGHILEGFLYIPEGTAGGGTVEEALPGTRCRGGLAGAGLPLPRSPVSEPGRPRDHRALWVAPEEDYRMAASLFEGET